MFIFLTLLKLTLYITYPSRWTSLIGIYLQLWKMKKLKLIFPITSISFLAWHFLLDIFFLITNDLFSILMTLNHIYWNLFLVYQPFLLSSWNYGFPIQYPFHILHSLFSSAFPTDTCFIHAGICPCSSQQYGPEDAVSALRYWTF